MGGVLETSIFLDEIFANDFATKNRISQIFMALNIILPNSFSVLLTRSCKCYETQWTIDIIVLIKPCSFSKLLTLKKSIDGMINEVPNF